MAHPGPDVVFRIDGRTVSTAIKFEGQPGPNGITWDSGGRRFVIVPFADKAISAWTPATARRKRSARAPGCRTASRSSAPEGSW